MGVHQIYEEMEEEYLTKLKKYGQGFCVDEGGEFEEYFERWSDAKKYAKQHNIEQIKAEGFGYCWGAYCDGEYEEYKPALLDLDKRVIMFLED